MNKLVEAARTYLETPFRHQGRSERALDCVGLALKAAADAGHPYEDQTDYSRLPHAQELRKALVKRLGEPLPKQADLAVGDIVEIRYGRESSHVALVGDYLYGGLSLIHTDAMRGKVVEHRLDEKWRKRIEAIYRIET